MSGFVVGGAVPVDSAAYVERAFEAECFAALTAGDWVLLLGPRQHGKSSALARLRRALVDAGYQVGSVDFQAFAAPDDSYEALLAWFARRLAQQWGSAVRPPPAADAHDLESWLEAAAPAGSGSLALFIDEASALPDTWRVQFYSQFRALHTARADAAPEAVSRRLAVLFCGTFRPELLVREDTNSPFNVSTDVRPENFTRQQVAELATRVTGGDLEPWSTRVFELVGGQPFLVQYFLAAVAAAPGDDDRAAAFATALERLRSGRVRHFTAMFERIVVDPSLSRLVARLAEHHDGIPVVPGDKEQSFLQVVGVATVDGGRLKIANELYREFALADPAVMVGPLPAAVRQPLLHRDAVAFDFCQHDGLRAMASAAYNGGVVAYNAGFNRLALASLGSAVEAVLIDLLTSLPEGELESARTSVTRPPTPPRRPEAWKFHELIAVAHKTTRLAGVEIAFSDALRDWRNEIHPGKAMRAYRPDSEFDPEVRIATQVLEILIRELA